MGFESVLLHSPNKGFCACLGDLPPGMPRCPETLSFCSKAALICSGWIVLRVAIAKGNSIHRTCGT